MSDDAIAEHDASMLYAFATLRNAEDRVSAAKQALNDVTEKFGADLNAAERAVEEAWCDIQTLMEESGEVEVLIPGALNDAKIAWSTPRETVKVVDPLAVPDHLCKIERKPKLKEIGDELKALRESGQPLPNWAVFELGRPKLGWRAVKKSAAA